MPARSGQPHCNTEILRTASEMGPKRSAVSEVTPRKIPKGQIAAPSPPAFHDQTTAEDDGDDSVNDVNKQYTAKFEPMISRVIAAFEGIQAKAPLSIQDGGTSEPMTQENIDIGMKGEKGVVSGAGNLFWHDIRWRPQSCVPINEEGIMDIKRHSFKNPPTTVNFSVYVAFSNEKK